LLVADTAAVVVAVVVVVLVVVVPVVVVGAQLPSADGAKSPCFM
jgi:hypothetical protein